MNIESNTHYYSIGITGDSPGRTAVYRLYLVINKTAKDTGVTVRIVRCTSNNVIRIPYKNTVISIPADRLIAVTSSDHYVDLHTDAETLHIHLSYSNTVRYLDPDLFVEINRGVLLNMSRISHRERDYYVTDTNERYAIRINKRKEVTSRVNDFKSDLCTIHI